MKLYTLRREQLIARPLPEVFDFFARPENLARITPPAMAFQILTPLPIGMKPGALIDYTVRTLGIALRWTTLITDFDPPHRFADVHIKGPYSFWHHTHLFAATDGGTLITDDVRYGMPFGFLGRIVHALVVKRQLAGIFDYRRQIIENLLSVPGIDKHLPLKPSQTSPGKQLPV